MKYAAIILAGLVVICGISSSCGAAEQIASIAAKVEPTASGGLFEAGSTTLPAGEYKLIDAKKGVQYSLQINDSGKIIVKDIRSLEVPNSGTATQQNPVLAPANAAPNAAVTAPAATTEAAPSAPAQATAKTGGSSKVEQIIQSQLNKQIKKQAPKIEQILNKF